MSISCIRGTKFEGLFCQGL